jgi:serine beta-lactamase-like protein LACTB, mitochondrial
VSKMNRPGMWILVFLTAVGMLFTFVIIVLPVIMKSTATRLHPQPASAPSVTSPVPTPQWTEAIERGRQAMRASLSERNLPGLSVAVAVDGNLVWAEGFGWSDIEKRRPVTPDTRFRIGTASKVLTSAGVGVLLEKGRLRLDDDIQKHVPEFPPKQWPVKLRHLMAHTAGVGTDSGDEGPLFSQHCERPVEALPAFAERNLRFEPGTEYRYSKYGWILVSAATETAAKEPFLTFMQNQVFKPLGMNDTKAESASTDIPNRASFYFPRFGSDPRYGLHPMRDLELSCYAGSMVFLSTPSDMVRFGLAMSGGKLLKPETVRLLQTSQVLSSGKQTGYGLGWDLETVTLAGKPTVAIGHDGDSLGGDAVSFMTFPEHGIVVAVMSNISYAETPAVALKVAEAFVRQVQ